MIGAWFALSALIFPPTTPGTIHKVPPALAVRLAPGVPRQDTARAQLDHATTTKRGLRGRRGESRERARMDAVAAYRAVRQYFPRDRALSAEASFRAGELLRSGRSHASALAEFEHARVLGKDTVFRARAGLEIGHIHRRAGRTMNALTSYEAVQAQGGEFAEQRHQATYWAGRSHARLGRPGDARRCFERAAREGVYALDRVRAFDAWADALIEIGDLEGAAGVLGLCRSELHDQALEESELGLRLRAALEGMRSVGRLARAVEDRRKRRALQPPRHFAVPPRLFPPGGGWPPA